MQSLETLERQFEERWSGRRISGAVAITSEGLVLGAGAVLARMAKDRFGRESLLLAQDGDRAPSLLAAAFGRPFGAETWVTRKPLRRIGGAARKRWPIFGWLLPACRESRAEAKPISSFSRKLCSMKA